MRALHRLSLLASLIVLFCTPAFAQTHTTNVTVSSMQVAGATGGAAPMPFGTVCAYAVNAQQGGAVSVTESGWGLVPAGTQICGNVVTGAISGGINVPDANASYSAAPFNYNFVIQQTDASGDAIGLPVQINNVAGVTGSSWALDAYTPPVSVPAAPPVFGYGSSVPSSCTAPSIWVTTSGNYYFCGSSGTYAAVSPGPTGPTGPPGGSLSYPGVASDGAGGLTSATLNGTMDPTACGRSAAPSWCAGSDIGAWVNAAIAHLGGQSAVGRIEIPAGTYTQTTTIVKPRAVILSGQGVGTLLNYTGSGNAIQVVDNLGADSYFPYLGGIENMHLHGPSTSAGVALYFGCNLGSGSACTNYYGDDQFVRNVPINNFKNGIEFGSNAFLLDFQNIGMMNTLVTVGITTDPANNVNAGENINFVGGSLSSQQVAVNTWPLHFFGTSFDVYPSSTYPTFVNTAIDCISCHYEAISGVGPAFVSSNAVQATFIGGSIFYDQSSTSLPYIFGFTGTWSNLYLTGVDLAANAPTIGSLINDATTGPKNIYVADLIGSLGSTPIMQSGYNAMQEGVNIQAGGNFYPSSTASYNQYTVAGYMGMLLDEGAVEILGSNGALKLGPNQSQTDLIYISNTLVSAPNQAYATNQGYQVGGTWVVDQYRNGYFPTVTGPATAPSGSCSTNGVWVFSQDGHATFCASGTWTTKI